MRTKTLPRSVVMLAVQCGIWVAFAPVLSQMHQAVADHRHVFCPEHNRIEDEGPIQSPVLAEIYLSDQARQTRLCGLASSPLCISGGMECAFSNFSGHGFVHVFGRLPGIRSSVELTVRPLQDVSRRVVDALWVAPKNSPPGEG